MATALRGKRHPFDIALFATAFAATLFVLWQQAKRGRAPVEFVVPSHVPASSATPLRADVATPLRGVAHAPSAVELPDGRILVVWFEGSAEGAGDVRLRSATYRDEVWRAGPDVTDARRASRDLGRYINTVGNPVVFRHPSGEYWLVFVSVSVGGWSGSALNLMRSRDGERWSAAKRLTASPFLNISTLAKGPPLIMSDGSVALPAYHEMLGKFPELLIVSPDGRVIDKVRMGTGGRGHIQPWAVATGPRQAVAFLRGAGGRSRVLWRTETQDAGATWSRPKPVNLPNPTSPVALISLPERRLGMVFNDDPSLRTLTRLATASTDGLDWRRAGIVEDGRATGVFHRYHWLLTDSAGRVHLFSSAYREGGHVRAIQHRILGGDAFASGEGDHVP
jgi:hypothetical protein